MMAPATLALVLPPQSECVMILRALSLYSAHGYTGSDCECEGHLASTFTSGLRPVVVYTLMPDTMQRCICHRKVKSH